MSDYCDKRLFVFSFDYEFDTHVSLYKGHTAVVVSTDRVLGDGQGKLFWPKPVCEKAT